MNFRRIFSENLPTQRINCDGNKVTIVKISLGVDAEIRLNP